MSSRTLVVSSKYLRLFFYVTVFFFFSSLVCIILFYLDPIGESNPIFIEPISESKVKKHSEIEYKDENLKRKEYARTRKKRIFNQKSSPLSKLFVEKFEKGIRGDIDMRGLINPTIDCVPIIHNGIGFSHKTHMLDYFSARDPKLHKYLRYENHEKDHDWGEYPEGYVELENSFFREYEENHPDIDNFVSRSKIQKFRQVDGFQVHLCFSFFCRRLQEKGNFDYQKNENGNDEMRDVINITKRILLKQAFGGTPEGPKSAVVYQNNNFVLQHVFKDDVKVRALCDLGLCQGIENYVLDSSIINYKRYPKIGYPYLGTKLGGNIFNSLFQLHSRLQPQFDNFVEENVEGMLIGLQIRAKWMNSYTFDHMTAEWNEWVSATKTIISENEKKMMKKGEKREGFTIFIACDENVPLEVLNEFRTLDGVNKVLTNDDYPFNEGQKNAKLEIPKYLSTEEVILSVVFDFQMLSISDVTIITFASSFGQIAGGALGLSPPYVMFHEYVLPNQMTGDNQGLQRPRIYSWWSNKWDEILHLSWLFNGTDDVFDEDVDYV